MILQDLSLLNGERASPEPLTVAGAAGALGEEVSMEEDGVDVEEGVEVEASSL